MILPTKHIKLSNSLLNIGAVILTYLEDKQTISILWEKIRMRFEIKSFEQFILALDLLFMLDAVTFAEGLLRRTIK